MLAFFVVLVSTLAAPAPQPTWQGTLDTVSKAVVSIEVTATRDFDTEDAGTSYGTGFVVDAARGLILTNRHMVHAGPVNARATFLDNEEVTLRPIYRDPVHDFGIYQFDVSKVRFMPLVALPLAPDAARVGLDIRVVGNNAGEKLSILDGTLARLDRNAPEYGGDTYNDFDTFYYQAASNTSGGSSGSPVVDLLGRAVALNAGGATQNASSFYLPLFRVARALALIQQGLPVSRGTIQANFIHQPWEDVVRLGLRDQTQVAVRAADKDGDGMLVVTKVQVEGPAAPFLRTGDVLVKVDGKIATGFLAIDDTLDAHVGGSVTLSIERLGQPMDVTIPIGDLHAITPDEYLDVGHAILNDLSYQQARNHDLPVRGVYVASTGYFLGTGGVSEGDLITAVDGVPTPDLATIQAQLETKADKARVRLRVVSDRDPKRPRETVVTFDRTWFGMSRCIRDDVTGTWPCVVSPPPPPAAAQAPPTVLLPTVGDKLTRQIGAALVLVGFQVPYSTGGLSGQSFVGTGVVVDKARGLVVVDRDTVPVALGDLTLTFGGTVRVPGTVLWLNPLHDYAIVQYDPAAIGAVPVSEVAFDGGWSSKGDKVRVVGLDSSGNVVSDGSEVEAVDALFVPAAGTPRFRDTNVEVISLGKVERCVGGVIVDKHKRVVGLWASYFFPRNRERYFYGLPSAYITPVIDAVRRGETPTYRAIGAELSTISLADARERGLDDGWVGRYAQSKEDMPRLLEVEQVIGGSGADGVLQPNDILVANRGAPILRMRDVETWSKGDVVPLTVLRNGALVSVEVPTTPLSGDGIRDALNWAGVVLHAPHLEVASQQGVPATGVYVAWYWYGSPGARDGLRPARRIVKVGDVEIHDLDQFIAVVGALDPHKPIVLTLEDLDRHIEVRPIELDLDKWPTERIRATDGHWTRERLAP